MLSRQDLRTRLAKAAVTLLCRPYALLRYWPHANIESLSWSQEEDGGELVLFREAGLLNRGCMLLQYTTSSRRWHTLWDDLVPASPHAIFMQADT